MTTARTYVANTNKSKTIAYELNITGVIQGVGFRPLVYCLAYEKSIVGWVQNDCGCVRIHAEGTELDVEQFVFDLLNNGSLVSISLLEKKQVKLSNVDSFTIKESGHDIACGAISIPKDVYLCGACKAELLSNTNRRGTYSFIACSECGPRFSMLRAMPYDRKNMSMSAFPMCELCRKEYQSPTDRRFHAQPISCRVCGPEVFCSTVGGRVVSQGDVDVVATVVAYLNQGKIVALKSIGGYHLLCDAQSTEAVDLLRQRKNRPDKPFAVMLPEPRADETSEDWLDKCVAVDSHQRALLLSPVRPILLAKKQSNVPIADNVAPMLRDLGVMLPCSGLHLLIMQQFNRPMVATSGNIYGEPMVTSTSSAQQHLTMLADIFVHHNRDIFHKLDDSVLRTLKSGTIPIRLGRGISPIELSLPYTVQEPMLAVGANQKNTVAIALNNRLIVTPHIGDLDSPIMQAHFEKCISDFQALYHVHPQRILCDSHPGYISSRWAKGSELPTTKVLHHHAHASAWALAAEISTPSLVFVWDGTGLGENGEMWGGEVFCGTPGNWKRVASLAPMKLQGGNKVPNQPWRSAASLVWGTNFTGIDFKPFDPQQLSYHAWQNELNCHVSSSMGRLFDAAAFACCEQSEVSYEGQAPMMLESVASTPSKVMPLSLVQKNDEFIQMDWRTLVPELFDFKVSPQTRAANFHASLIETVWEVTLHCRKKFNFDHIGLAGGVFQNRILCDGISQRFLQSDIPVVIPSSLPLNDAAISVGQIHEYCSRRS